MSNHRFYVVERIQSAKEAFVWLKYDIKFPEVEKFKPVTNLNEYGYCCFCGRKDDNHGFIPTPKFNDKYHQNAGFLVCPGDYVVCSEYGDLYRYSPKEFNEKFKCV